MSKFDDAKKKANEVAKEAKDKAVEKASEIVNEAAESVDLPKKGDKNNLIFAVLLILGALLGGYFFSQEGEVPEDPEEIEEVIPETPSEPTPEVPKEEPVVVDSMPVIPVDTPDVSQLNVSVIDELKLELVSLGKKLLEARVDGDEVLVDSLEKEQIRVNKLLNEMRKE